MPDDDPCRQMHVIVDECLGSRRVCDLLEPRGHTVVGVGTAFPQGSPDASILAVVEEKGAVLLTTDNDYKSLGKRLPGSKKKWKRANRVLFVSLQAPAALARLEALIDDIEREYHLHCSRGMRMTMWITTEQFRVER